MTPTEQVAFAWKHRDHFEAVTLHNLEVTNRRRRGGDWSAPENQYRNAWTELNADTQPAGPPPARFRGKHR